MKKSKLTNSQPKLPNYFLTKAKKITQSKEKPYKSPFSSFARSKQNMYIMGVKGGTILLNQIVLVGRLANDPELYETETGKKVARVVLAVPRPYKNIEGEYESDFISCKLWQGIATSTTDYCKKGDLVGIKGRLQTYNYETEEGKKYLTEVIAEKVTFLSSKNKD